MMTEVVGLLGDGMSVDVSTALARLGSSRLLAVLADDVIPRDLQSVGDQSGGVRAHRFGDLSRVEVLEDSRAMEGERVRGVVVQDLELAVSVATRVSADMASCDVAVTRNGVRMTEPGRGIGSHGLNRAFLGQEVQLEYSKILR